MSKRHRYPTIAALIIALCGLFFGAAQAATITVNSNADGSDPTDCTLRDAVGAINNAVNYNGCTNTGGAYGTADTINFAAGLNGATIEVANSGQIAITKTLTIDGLVNTANGIILDAKPSGGVSANRIFYVSGGSALTVKGLTFQNGNAGSSSGGAIGVNLGNHALTLDQCTFTGNKAGNGGAVDINFGTSTIEVLDSTFSGNEATFGGAIYAINATVSSSTFSGNTANGGGGGAIDAINATVSSSTFSENTTTGQGGAIWAITATVSSSTFSDNEAGGSGGAIYAGNYATVSSSTFSDNTATSDGGAINASTATVSSSTFSENTAGNGGGAIYAGENLDARHLTLVNNTAAVNGGASIFVNGFGGGKTFALHNSIIVGAQSDAHCAVSTTNNPTITGSYNLEWTSAGGGTDGTSCGISNFISAGAGVTITDIVSTILADNGGATQTLALSTGSPAIGKADKTVNGTSQMWDLATGAWANATEDQRGSARKAVGTGRDLGAYETNALLLNGSPPNAIIGDTYNDNSIATTGGTGPYSYAVTRGALPPGLTLDPTTGAISGTPTQAGIYDFAVTATDSAGELTGKGFIIIIAPRALGGVSIPVLPLPLLLILAGLLVGVGFRYQWSGGR